MTATRRAPAIHTFIAVLALSACSGAPPPSSGSPSATTASPSTPAATATPAGSTAPSVAPTAAPASPSGAPLPGGRLAYGRLDTSGVTPFTSNTDGTDEQRLMPPPAEGPSWSPNGQLVALVVVSPQGLLGTGLVKSDGSDFVPFDSPDASLNVACNVWSPDGSRLACEGWDDTDVTRNGIYTVRATDGGDLVRVTESPTGHHDTPGDYSLDGSQIFFARGLPEDLRTSAGDDSHLMVVNLDGSDEHRLSEQLMGGAKLSPDGTTVLTDSGKYLTLVPASGGEATPIHIADAPNDLALRGAWSPDGQWIVFSLFRGSAPHADIYIMRRDGSELHQVTSTPDYDEEFSDWTAAPGPVARGRVARARRQVILGV